MWPALVLQLTCDFCIIVTCLPWEQQPDPTEEPVQAVETEREEGPIDLEGLNHKPDRK